MGEYAAAYVAAMQWGAAYDGAPADTRGVPLKTANTCKHFAGYGLELWNGTIRYAFNAEISRQDLYAAYLPAFQACVQLAKVAMLMCSCVISPRSRPFSPPPRAAPLPIPAASPALSPPLYPD